jgi:hypothetical protein
MSLPESEMGESVAAPSLEARVALPVAPVAHPLPAPGELALGRSRVRVHAMGLALLLFLVPLLAYWPAIFHVFGLRDDYSNLRESHEELGKVLIFCASHARPIYGWLLQSSYGLTPTVQALEWMRLGAALLLGALSFLMCRGLLALGWSFGQSLCIALMLALVPSAQVMASWAVGWPYALTALLAAGAFFVADGPLQGLLRGEPGKTALPGLLSGLALMVVCALTYQPSALFYLVPLGAGLIAQRERRAREALCWMALHLALVGVALALAYAAMMVLYDAGVFVRSARIAFEHEWGEKLLWFVHEPLPNALSLFVLNDDHERHRALFLSAAALAALVLGAGCVLEWRRYGRGRGLIWLLGLVALPTLAFAISLVASERYATYRTIYALTAVLLCFGVASVHALTERLGGEVRALIAACALGAAFLTAQHHSYALIAVPQGHEWQLILDGAKQVRLRPGKRPGIFAIASSPADISTASIYHDEFGSLSSNSEWVPREMFKRAMHDTHRDVADLESRYQFASGPKLPSDRHYDVVIDLHRLRRFYLDN